MSKQSRKKKKAQKNKQQNNTAGSEKSQVIEKKSEAKEVKKLNVDKSESKSSEEKDSSKHGEKVFNKKIHVKKSEHNYVKAFDNKLNSPLRKILRPFKFIARAILILIAIFIILCVAVFIYFGRDLPDVTKLKQMNFAQTTHIYDRDGNELYRIFGDENREYVALNDITPSAIEATLAIEDKNFYRHLGFDLFGIIRAQLRNFQDDSISQGASTITQQLAKNVYLSTERTYERKVKEILLALQIEWHFSKDDILEMYLNKIGYGSNSYGIEAASESYFGTSAKNLSLVQSAVLASLPKAPSDFSPYGPNAKLLMGYCEAANTDEDTIQGETQQLTQTQQVAKQPETQQPTQASTQVATTAGDCESPYDSRYIWGRKDFVLQRMVEDKYITKDQLLQAWKEGMSLKFKEQRHKIDEEHFVFYVRDYLEKKYGKEVVESGGLQVKTSLDPKLQAIAKKAIQDHVGLIQRYGANNAGLLALDPKTGNVLAMVGSKDYWDPKIDGNVNVTLSYRQPGSSFKPLIYAAAIQNAGIGSGTYIGDYKTLFNGKNIPNNYDGRFMGKMTVRTALGGSRNIPAIKAYYIAGEEEKVLDFIEKLGITSLREFRNEFNKDAEKRGWTFFYGWPMAIGSGEVRMIDLVGAYATFANQGIYNAPNPILEVRDSKGNIIESVAQEKNTKQAIDPQIAYIISSMLSDVAARPAGSWRNLLTIPGQNVAAKTGTSNKVVRGRELPNNNWTIGYTPSLAAGVWVGNTDGKNLYNSAYSLYTTDPIYHQFFVDALKDKPREEFPKPEGIKTVGREVYPNWGGQKDFEKMFKRLDNTQQKVQDIPLPDFLRKNKQDIQKYNETKAQVQQQD